MAQGLLGRPAHAMSMHGNKESGFRSVCVCHWSSANVTEEALAQREFDKHFDHETMKERNNQYKAGGRY